MNLFTSLMPGVRQLRTPLAVGSLWLVVLYLAMWQGWSALESSYSALASLGGAVRSVPVIYVVGALTFTAYIVGSATQGLSVGLGRIVRRVVARIEATVRDTRGATFARWRGYLYAREDHYPVRGTIMDAVSSKFAESGISSSAYLSFPIGLIEAELESMTLQLWQKAADQYQESDRLRAESAFRVGVSLPLGVIGVQLSLLVTWWIWIPFSIGAIVLILQSRRLNLERRALLANALRQGLAENATLNATARIIPEVKTVKPISGTAWYAVTAVALDRSGSGTGHEETIRSGVLEMSQELNFELPTWKAKIDSIVDEIRGILLNNGDEEGYEYFEREVVKAQKRAEKALATFDETARPGDRKDWAARRAWYGGA